MNIKIFFPSIALAKFQVLNRNMWLVSTLLDRIHIEYVHHHRKFCQTGLFETMVSVMKVGRVNGFGMEMGIITNRTCWWIDIVVEGR